MISSWMVSLLFFAVSTVVLASGIFTLQSNYRAAINRVFFYLTLSIAIWSSGMALSTVAADAGNAEIFRRVSAIGWSTTYTIMLHFILIITDKASLLKKWWFYICLYLPSFLSILAFAVPNRINPYPYNFHQTAYGWINVAHNNVWDWMFYVYYISTTLVGLFILYKWSKKSSDDITKKKSRTIFLSIIFALIIGTITDVVLSSMFSKFPQMAPVIMLIPVLSTYHVLQKDSFSIIEGMDKKTSYMVLFINVLIYIILSTLQFFLSNNSFDIDFLSFDQSIIRGIFVQIQMFLSIYLVLKENRPGYISAVIMNFISLLSAVLFLMRFKSFDSLPGIISYAGVLVIIKLIKTYKEKNSAYIKKINTQVVREKYYSNIFKQAPVGIAIMNDKNHTINVEYEDININPTYAKILGRTKEELQKITWTEITYLEDIDADMKYFKQFKNGEINQYSIEKRFIKADGSTVWVNMLVAPFSTSGEKSDEHLCIITDITKRKNIEATLNYNNEHVQLTGLYNRGILVKVLEKDSLISSVNKRALLCINLSAMHSLSLRYGYSYNQTMLKNIANSLKVFCNDNYLLFNSYEYRFVFYVKDYEDEKELTYFGEKVSAALSSYLHIHGIGVGIGILQIDKSEIQDSDEILKSLMNTSEMAVKNNQNNNILFYSSELDIQITRENEISKEIMEISEGIKPDRLYLQYQPILDITSNKVCGFEALARLRSEKHGLVTPLEFIPIAEKTNMITSLGDRINILALNFLHKLKENGKENISLSINISTIQILENGFADRLLSAIMDMQLDPENVGIELTESVFATERSEINAVIDILKSAGIKVYIDDFGTGYSSFARVQELNIDFLKIDKSFIDKLMDLKPEEAIAGDIISMAHKMGHCVVAEGVEYEKQLNYLRQHGCDRIQGYIISRPLDEDAVFSNSSFTS